MPKVDFFGIHRLRHCHCRQTQNKISTAETGKWSILWHFMLQAPFTVWIRLWTCMVKMRKSFSLQLYLVCNLFIVNFPKMSKEMELNPKNGPVYCAVIKTVLLGNNRLMKTYYKYYIQFPQRQRQKSWHKEWKFAIAKLPFLGSNNRS